MIEERPGSAGMGKKPLERRALDARGGRRPSLREDVAKIDQEILYLLLKRYNLLEKMRHKNRMDAADEKYLREKWQASATKLSRDPVLSGKFFAMMQELSFLPKPKQENEAGQSRPAFNLAPARKSVKLDLTAPLDNEFVRAWLYLACASGQALELQPVTGCFAELDCMRAFAQMGAKIARDKDSETIRVDAAPPMACPDRVLHAGDSDFNFFLFLAHYIGRPSRVKITGDTSLKIADYSALRHMLPELGTRLVHVVPKSNGLPARLECSGILPDKIAISADLPGKFAMALFLAAPFYERPVGIDLSAHAQKAEIMAHVLPMLTDCGITFVVDNDVVNLEPSTPKIPARPVIAMDRAISPFLLALALPLGGRVSLAGFWPAFAETRDTMDILAKYGMRCDISPRGIVASKDENGAHPDVDALPEYGDARVLYVCAAACEALGRGKGQLPQVLAADADVLDFMRSIKLEMQPDGAMRVDDSGNAGIYNAPTAAWALAFAVTALARVVRGGCQLGNPAIINELWPGFWQRYNMWTNPPVSEKTQEEETRNRRRILTSVVAVPPEIREEDWER